MQRLCILFIAAFIWLPSAAAAGPELIVEVDRTRLYEGESLVYRVTLNHVENPVEPDMTALRADFHVTSLGQQSLNSRSITIINGQRSEVVRYGRQYNYRLMPLRSGKLTIPSPTVKVDGRRLTGREVSLTVLAPDQQGVVRMKITSDRDSVYPMQPFTVTLSIAVKALPPPYENKNPVGVQSTPPALQIPWAVDDGLPQGLVPKLSDQQWLGGMENVRGVGFSVNNLRPRSVIALFEERNYSFQPEPEKVHLADHSGKETDYYRFDFRRTFTAERIGDYTFGPATLKGAFAVGVADGRPVGEDIYAVAKPLTVAVKDVPEEGRPDCYIGAIGQFELAARLTPKKVKTGDPMTLTLVLTGRGAWDGVAPPKLQDIPEITDHFKIYEATEETKGNRREFTYSLRPLEAGISVFPAIPVAYFNVETNRYVTIHSEPIPIEVTKAVKLKDRDIVAPGLTSNGNHRELEMSREGIFANITDSSQFADQSVRPRLWLAFLGGLVGVYVLFALTLGGWRRVSGNTALLRRRMAAGNARNVLRRASAEFTAGRAAEGADLVRAALLGLIADTFDLLSAGLTPAEACRRLESLGVEADLVRRFKDLLETCEGVRYGGAGGASASIGRDAQHLLRPLATALKKLKIK
ncbi:MAG: BatD family protein [Pirellulales bacterium]|nr:BatD family protein [Pirellulales bacterium]